MLNSPLPDLDWLLKIAHDALNANEATVTIDADVLLALVNQLHACGGALVAWEAWEARIIGDNRCWEPEGMATAPRLTEEIWGALTDDGIQDLRNNALAAFRDQSKKPSGYQAVSLRPTLAWFAQLIETELRAHDHHGGWEEHDVFDLWRAAESHMIRLRNEIVFGDFASRIRFAAKTAADIMMVASLQDDKAVERQNGYDRNSRAWDRDYAEASARAD